MRPAIGDMGVLELYSDSGFHGQVLDQALGRVGSRAFPRGERVNVLASGEDAGCPQARQRIRGRAGRLVRRVGTTP